MVKREDSVEEESEADKLFVMNTSVEHNLLYSLHLTSLIYESTLLDLVDFAGIPFCFAFLY